MRGNMKALTETNLPGLSHKGKVRDTYELGSDQLLMVATDRISAFDVILPTGIPSKGIILNKILPSGFARQRIYCRIT